LCCWCCWSSPMRRERWWDLEKWWDPSCKLRTWKLRVFGSKMKSASPADPTGSPPVSLAWYVQWWTPYYCNRIYSVPNVGWEKFGKIPLGVGGKEGEGWCFWENWQVKLVKVCFSELLHSKISINQTRKFKWWSKVRLEEPRGSTIQSDNTFYVFICLCNKALLEAHNFVLRVYLWP
jgi:hypothetical protein